MKIIATTICAALVLGNILFVNSDDLPPSHTLSIHEIIVKAAIVYHIDPVPLYKVAKCESGLDPLAWNKNDPNGGSKGILQFQKTTFLSGAKTLGIKNPDIWNTQQQAQIGAYMVKNGQLSAWSCARKLHLLK